MQTHTRTLSALLSPLSLVALLFAAPLGAVGCGDPVAEEAGELNISVASAPSEASVAAKLAAPAPIDLDSAAQACKTDVMGSDSSCKDAATWKQYSYEACKSAGLELNAYSPYDSCGEGLYRYVKYECCGASTPAPTPEPTPALCFGDVMGSDSSCKSTSTWKQYASNACAKEGSTLQDYAVYEKCGVGRFRYVKYYCCNK